MKNQDLAVIGVRLLGLYALLQLTQQLGLLTSIVLSSPGFQVGPLIQVFGNCLVIVGVAVALLYFAPRIAVRLAPDPEKVESIDSSGLQAMVLATIGVYLIVRSIPGLLSQVIPGIPVTHSAGIIVAGLLQLIFGLALFFRAQDIARFWHRMRDSRYEQKA